MPPFSCVFNTLRHPSLVQTCGRSIAMLDRSRFARIAISPHVSSCRAFSSEDSPQATKRPEEIPFRSEKARAMFLRITQTCSKEDVRNLGDAINRQLGRHDQPDCVFFSRFGFAGGPLGGLGNAAMAHDAETAPPVEVKTTFDIKLAAFDEKAKIKVIKEVRAIAGLGLKEAKDLVESAPAVIQKDLPKEKAEDIKKLLEDLGATVEII